MPMTCRSSIKGEPNSFALHSSVSGQGNQRNGAAVITNSLSQTSETSATAGQSAYAPRQTTEWSRSVFCRGAGASSSRNGENPTTTAAEGEGQPGHHDSFFAITIRRNTRKEIYSNGRRGGCYQHAGYVRALNNLQYVGWLRKATEGQ